jgi:hypothetical protein
MDFDRGQYDRLYRLIDIDADMDYVSIVYAIDNLLEG